MKDLEICKRIAEIEHGACFVDGDDSGNFINLNHPMSDRGGEMYNPLTDKALCFDLMVKHDISLINVKDSTASYAVWDDSTPELKKTEVGTNPQRAICLAIIAKHENNNEN